LIIGFHVRHTAAYCYGSGKAVIDETINDAGGPLVIKWHNDSVIKIPIGKK